MLEMKIISEIEIQANPSKTLKFKYKSKTLIIRSHRDFRTRIALPRQAYRYIYIYTVNPIYQNVHSSQTFKLGIKLLRKLMQKYILQSEIDYLR